MKRRSADQLLRDAAVREEFQAALATLAAAAGRGVAIRAFGQLVAGDPALPARSGAEQSEVEIYGCPAVIHTLPTGPALALTHEHLVGLVEHLLEQSYKVEDLASGELECFEFEYLLLHGVETVARFGAAGVIEVVTGCLEELVRSELGFTAAAAVLRGEPDEPLHAWVRQAAPETTFAHRPPADDELSGELQRLWAASGGDRPAARAGHLCDGPLRVLMGRLGLPVDGLVWVFAFAPPAYPVAGLLCVGGPSQAEPRSIEQQWLTILLQLMAGAVASAVWRKADAERRTAEARAEAFRETAAMAAHKIKNPVFWIQGHLDLLREELETRLGGLPEPVAKRLDSIAERSRRIGQTAGLFQRFARSPEPVLAATELAPLVEDVRSGPPDPGPFRVTRGAWPPEPVEVWVDGEMLRSVLEELLGNAMAVMPDGGRIELACEGPFDPGDSPLSAQPGRHYVLSVSDDGPGLAGAAKLTVFEPFVTRRAGGTGLGLSIVRDHCAKMGCAVVEDGPPRWGRGARFRIGLPVVPERDGDNDGERET